MERRIALLERPQNGNGIDPLVLAMETLDDTEIGILQEYMSLLNAGFSLDEVLDMMGEDSYQQALAITDKVEAELRFRQYSEPEYKTVKKEMGDHEKIRPERAMHARTE